MGRTIWKFNPATGQIQPAPQQNTTRNAGRRRNPAGQRVVGDAELEKAFRTLVEYETRQTPNDPIGARFRAAKRLRDAYPQSEGFLRRRLFAPGL